jgi:hypothetical protein
VTRTEAIRDEERRARHVRIIVNFTTSVIAQGNLTRREAEALVAAARRKILDLFPGQEDTYELLYARRFARLVDEFARRDAPTRGTLVPFPRQPS